VQVNQHSLRWAPQQGKLRVPHLTQWVAPPSQTGPPAAPSQTGPPAPPSQTGPPAPPSQTGPPYPMGCAAESDGTTCGDHPAQQHGKHNTSILGANVELSNGMATKSQPCATFSAICLGGKHGKLVHMPKMWLDRDFRAVSLIYIAL
jgi:hypothetical protein